MLALVSPGLALLDHITVLEPSVVSGRHWLSLVTCELTEDWRWWRAGGAETRPDREREDRTSHHHQPPPPPPITVRVTSQSE